MAVWQQLLRVPDILDDFLLQQLLYLLVRREVLPGQVLVLAAVLGNIHHDVGGFRGGFFAGGGSAGNVVQLQEESQGSPVQQRRQLRADRRKVRAALCGLQQPADLPQLPLPTAQQPASYKQQ